MPVLLGVRQGRWVGLHSCASLRGLSNTRRANGLRAQCLHGPRATAARKTLRTIEGCVMARHKDTSWDLPTAGVREGHIMIAMLMDIRDELKNANKLLKAIDKNTQKKKPTKRSRQTQS